MSCLVQLAHSSLIKTPLYSETLKLESTEDLESTWVIFHHSAGCGGKWIEAFGITTSVRWPLDRRLPESRKRT